MDDIDQCSVGNRLLALMPKADFALLQPHLTRVELPLRHVLSEPHQPIEHAHFLESGISCVVSDRGARPQTEIGVCGREGMVGITLVFGSDRTPHLHFMQVSGAGLRIAAAALSGAIEHSRPLHKFLLRYALVFGLHTSLTAVANVTQQTEERLARWLLICEDRLDSGNVPLTHELLAGMLGVHRPGVTEAIHVLVGRGCIEARRGLIVVLNRPELKRLAGASYGVVEAEYERLIGPMVATKQWPDRSRA